MEIQYGSNCIGFVIRIISETELIIDVGEDQLTIGDIVQVYEPSDEIFDLENNSLGIYERIKSSLKVIYTSTNYSVCSDQKEVTENIVSDMLATLPTNPLFPKTVVKDVLLSVNSEDIEPLSLDKTKTIKKGDPVKKR